MTWREMGQKPIGGTTAVVRCTEGEDPIPPEAFIGAAAAKQGGPIADKATSKTGEQRADA
jgi:hypothetical protein